MMMAMAITAKAMTCTIRRTITISTTTAIKCTMATVTTTRRKWAKFLTQGAYL